MFISNKNGGPPGPTGDAGTNEANGTAGVNGTNGATGATGSTGATDANSTVAGPTGATGANSTAVSWTVFVLALVVVVISLTNVIFPALILRTLGGLEDNMGVMQYEMGVWAYPVLATNVIFFGIMMLHWKKKLPTRIVCVLKNISNFELSPGMAFLIVSFLLGIFIVLSIHQLFDGKFFPDYYVRYKSYLETYNIRDFSQTGFGNHLSLLLDVISMKVFGNYKVVPFMASIALLTFTYLLTRIVSGRRLAGIIALVILMQSNVFLMYDAAPEYPNYWILLYLVSLYFVCRKWQFSVVPFILSLPTKGLTAAFLPMTLFFIYRSSLPKREKIWTIVTYMAIALAGILVLSLAGISLVYDSQKPFSLHDFWFGFTSFNLSFRLDPMIVLFLLPVTILLFIQSRKGIMQADSVLFLIMFDLLLSPLLTAFTGLTNEPYRFSSLVIFFGMGVGVLFSKLSSSTNNFPSYPTASTIFQEANTESPGSPMYPS